MSCHGTRYFHSFLITSTMPIQYLTRHVRRCTFTAETSRGRHGTQ
jgi:hypothetical protein